LKARPQKIKLGALKKGIKKEKKPRGLKSPPKAPKKPGEISR